MKKTIFSLIAGLTLVLGAASCSENGEEPVPAPVVNPDGTRAVTLTTELPAGIRSRANAETYYGDGSTLAPRLDYAIFEGDSKVPVICESKYGEVGQTNFSISVNLNPQKQYKVYFVHQWYAGSAYYNVDFSSTENYCNITKTSYSGTATESTDLFAGLFDIKTDGNTFTLKRPVAQISIVTDEDLSAFDLTTFKTRVGMSAHPHQYNEVEKGIDKTTSGLATVTTAYNRFDGNYMVYNGRQLKYLFVDYVFEYDGNVDFTVFFSDASGNISTKSVKLDKIEANTHYIIMPKGSGESGNEPGGSIVGSSTSLTVVKDTNFTNTAEMN